MALRTDRVQSDLERPRAPIAAAITLVAALLSACGGAVASPPPGSAATQPGASTLSSDAPAQPGGTLRIAQGGDLTQLDPHLANVTPELAVLFNVYETLGAFDDESLLVTPLLATEWTWTENDTKLVISLQDGVTFHDGAPFEAEDVKYSFERVLDPDLGSAYTSLINDIEAITVRDPQTVEFTTAGFSNKLIAALPNVAIIPRGSAEMIGTKPVGTGPFKWVEWIVNDHVTLEKNPTYWQEGLPLLDRIEVRPIADAETRNAALLSGQVDLLYNIALSDVDRFESDPGVRVALAPPVDQPIDAYINTKRAPFDKLEARQALSYAIDRQGFVDQFLGGLGEVAYSPLASSHWAFAESLEGKYEYDLAKAAELFAAAGYPEGEGLEFTMVIPAGFPEHKQISTMVQAAVTELGGTVTIEEDDIPVWVEKLNNHEFDLAFDSDVKHASDPAVLFGLEYLWHPGESNLSQFTEDMSPGYSELVEQASREKDQTKRVAMYQELQERFMDLAVGPMVAFRSIPHAMRTEVTGFEPAIQFHQSYAGVSIAP